MEDACAVVYLVDNTLYMLAIVEEKISILNCLQYATMLNNAMIDNKTSFLLISFQLLCCIFQL